jgi:low affinity Fe/Cu permease
MKLKIGIFETFAHKATLFSGSTIAFVIALFTVLLWLLSGSYFDYSNTWQLVINTGTTIVTFLMVFLIQRMQNKDAKAIHLKLNELVAALNGPSNRLIDAEEFTEEELDILSDYYKKLAEMAKKETVLSVSHSIEEAVALHRTKHSVGLKRPADKYHS